MESANDYEGKPIKVGDRIELHPGCDLWMRGARFGSVVEMAPRKGWIKVRMDHPAVKRLVKITNTNLRTIPGALVLP